MATVLIVDDEPDLRVTLRRVFERAGHVVVEAGHGAAALAAVNEKPPDVIVTDMVMPVMNGAELIKRLRANPATAAVPIIAVSGDAHLADDADVILQKPVLAKDVLVVVNQLLSRDESSST